jgi:hypothetical protein
LLAVAGADVSAWYKSPSTTDPAKVTKREYSVGKAQRPWQNLVDTRFIASTLALQPGSVPDANTVLSKVSALKFSRCAHAYFSRNSQRI